MIRFISLLTVLVVCYFIYGFYLSQVDVHALPPTLTPQVNTGLYDYRGVINVRTNRSSGSSSPMKVIEEAQAADMSFLILTDTDSPQSNISYSGFHGNLLVFDEREYQYLDSRLLLVSEKSQAAASAKNYMALTDTLSQKSSSNHDSFVSLAHPFRNDEPTWTGDLPAGIDALEVLNPKRIASTAWSHSKANVFWSLIIYPFNPDYGLLRLYREPTTEFATWDSELSRRAIWGMAGADASARAFPLTNYLLKFPRYLRNFLLATTHVLLNSELTGNITKDRARIFSALKNGHFYSSLDTLGNPSGFTFELRNKDKVLPMGSQINHFIPGTLHVELPIEPTCFFEIVLFKDGERIAHSNTKVLSFELKDPGVYRTIVRISPTFPFPEGKRWLTWIFSNPIIIRP